MQEFQIQKIKKTVNLIEEEFEFLIQNCIQKKTPGNPERMSNLKIISQIPNSIFSISHKSN